MVQQGSEGLPVSEKSVRISCSVKDHLPMEEMVEFQGDLKILMEENYEKLKKSILDTGFAFPIYLWKGDDGKNYISKK